MVNCDGAKLLVTLFPISSDIFGEPLISVEKPRAMELTVDGRREEAVDSFGSDGDPKLLILAVSARTDPLHIPNDNTWVSLMSKSPDHSVRICEMS